MEIQKQLQWFPGHMAKTRRLIGECLPDVDIVLELLDARIPYSSRNPELQKLIGQKPLLTLLNKSSLADPTVSVEWREYHARRGKKLLCIDCQSGEGLSSLPDAVREVLSEKIERYRARGMENRRLKAMIVGIPNVGKSSLINRLAGGKRAKVEDRPGVTMTKQWVSTDIGLSLLDMPGILWPKFDEREVGEHLAMTGAINDRIYDNEEIAMILAQKLYRLYPAQFLARYRLTEEEVADLDAYDLLMLIGRKRGFLISGGETDSLRTSAMLLDEFRGGIIGRISLERPPKGGRHA